MSEEEALIRAFVLKARRDRLIEFLSSRTRRHEATSRLAHFRDFDPRYVVTLSGNEQSPDAVARVLRQRGSGDTCHVISENIELDGKRVSLERILKDVIGSGWGTLISCIPGTLAYFEGEEPSDRCILSKRGGHAG